LLYVLIDEVRRYSLFLSLGNNSFFVPFDRLPALELDDHLTTVHVLEKIEENVPVDCVPCDVEGLVNLDEDCSHI